MSTLRSSIRNRDEGYQDDFVMIGIDTYGDGRYMVSLGANAEGNQLDLNSYRMVMTIPPRMFLMNPKRPNIKMLIM